MTFGPQPGRDYDPRVGQYTDSALGGPVAQAPAAVRAEFLQKVFLTLSGGVAVTMATAFGLLQHAINGQPQLIMTIVHHYWVVFVIYMVMALAAGAVARVRTVNLLAYVLFTAVTGVLISPLFLYAYVQAGQSYQIIWNAFGVTALVFGGLSGYVLISKKDFSFLGGFLWVGLLVLLGFIVGTFFLQTPAFTMGVTLGGIALFALFVLYDTSVIMHHLDASEWVAGALRLFVDFINLFIRILSIMSRRR